MLRTAAAGREPGREGRKRPSFLHRFGRLFRRPPFRSPLPASGRRTRRDPRPGCASARVLRILAVVARRRSWLAGPASTPLSPSLLTGARPLPHPVFLTGARPASDGPAARSAPATVATAGDLMLGRRAGERPTADRPALDRRPRARASAGPVSRGAGGHGDRAAALVRGVHPPPRRRPAPRAWASCGPAPAPWRDHRGGGTVVRAPWRRRRGGHPHCTRPHWRYRGVLIIYSLGNVVFDRTGTAKSAAAMSPSRRSRTDGRPRPTSSRPSSAGRLRPVTGEATAK